jgi:hypothetical protein
MSPEEQYQPKINHLSLEIATDGRTTINSDLVEKTHTSILDNFNTISNPTDFCCSLQQIYLK